MFIKFLLFFQILAKKIHKHLSKFNFTDTDGYEWHYVIRYNSNEEDMAVFDRQRFGNQVKFCKERENCNDKTNSKN